MKYTNESDTLREKKVPLTMIELFSGIGAQKKGIDLTNLYDCKVIATADIEKDAMVSYAAIHDGLTNELIESYEEYPSEEEMRKELVDKNIGFDFKKMTNPIVRLKGFKLKKYWLAMKLSNNLGDISKIKSLPLADFWTYSFPCQDISVAGKQSGIVKGQTRSGLLYEVERLLDDAVNNDTLPKYLLLENVKNLVGKKFIDQFNDWINRLDELGFNTYWEVINAKNCGIAQNRERVFALSIRKDVDKCTMGFPKPFDTGLRLRDFLETEADEKYYLSHEMQDRLQITDPTFSKSIIGTTKPDFRTIGQRDLVYQKDGTMGTLVATDYKQPKQILEEDTNRCIQAGTLNNGKWDKIYECARRYYSEDGISPTIHTCGGGNTEPKVEETEHSKWKQEMFSRFIEDAKNVESGVDANQSRSFGYRPPLKNLSKTLKNTTNDAGVVCNKRVRKLTPRECWRLMGFDDSDYNKTVSVGMSDSAGYRQAGNSIVTNCIALIMEHLYKAQYDDSYVCTDEVCSENFINPQSE